MSTRTKASEGFAEMKNANLLPSIKGVALSLMEAAAREDVSLAEICEIVLPDPALTAKMIKMANGAFYGGGRAVSSTKEALERIGFAQARQLALGMALVSETKGRRSETFDFGLYWRASVLMGSFAKEIGARAKMGVPEEIFTIGLLKGIGRVGLFSAFPKKLGVWPGERLSSARRRLAGEKDVWEATNRKLREKEEQEIGFSGEELGSEMMRDWRMPNVFCEALMLGRKEIDNPSGRAEKLGNLLYALEPFSLALAYEESMSTLKEEDYRKEFERIWMKEGLPKEAASSIFDEALTQSKEWIASLGIEKPKEERSSTQEPTSVSEQRINQEVFEAKTKDDVVFSVLIANIDKTSAKQVEMACRKLGGRARHLEIGESVGKLWVEGKFDGILMPAPETSETLRGVKALIHASSMRGSLMGFLFASEKGKVAAASLIEEGASWIGRTPIDAAGALSFAAMIKRASNAREENERTREGVRRYALDLEAANGKLERAANSDALTGLPNRRKMSTMLEEVEQSGDSAMLVVFDITDFGSINVEHGAEIGDELLIAIRDRMEERMGGARLARLGGNEFGILMKMDDSSRIVMEKRCSELFSEPFLLPGGLKLDVMATFGAAEWPGPSKRGSDVLPNAESALSANKREKSEGIRMYDAGFETRRKESAKMEKLLREALKKNELRLVFQPRVALRTGKMEGAEALMRWSSPELGEVPPFKFIPVAEEFGLIEEMGEWAVSEALRLTKPMLRFLPDFKVAVNLSSKQLRRGGVAKKIEQKLKEEFFPAELLELEVTESCAMENPEMAERELAEIKSLGCLMALDDFGTGHSSLSRLKRLPLDCLKIDRSFVKDTPDDKEDVAICKMVATLSQTLALDVVAEGVETEEQADLLRGMGVKWAQGFHFARPESMKKLLEWAADGGVLPQKKK